jgi:uncharacterized protein
VKVVSNASPLITLARLDLLLGARELFGTLHIPEAVYQEVVVAGAGMPGATAVEQASWIQVLAIQNENSLADLKLRYGLGDGETNAVALAQEFGADLVLMDELRGRRMALDAGLRVVGCVGVLEKLYERGFLGDLREAYWRLRAAEVRIDLRTLQRSLEKFGLPSL